ncbi:MAG: SxtJ family membrane protein [Candidatus Eremiobacterota bacterium]
MKDIDVVKTLNIISLACLVIYFIFNSRWLIFISLFLMFLNITGGRIPYFIAKGWMKFSSFIGNVNSRIILSVIFYLVLTPVAVLYRIFNRDAVNYFKVRNDSTYYKDVDTVFKKENFEKIW